MNDVCARLVPKLDQSGESEQSVPLNNQNRSNQKKTIRKRGSILIDGLEQRGPMLITHWGVSGPVILKLSGWGSRVLYETKYRG